MFELTLVRLHVRPVTQPMVGENRHHCVGKVQRLQHLANGLSATGCKRPAWCELCPTDVNTDTMAGTLVSQ